MKNQTHSNSAFRQPYPLHGTNGKSTDDSAQWVRAKDGKLPPRAFDPNESERKRFHFLAHCVSLDDVGRAELERIGGNIFDACVGAQPARFDAKVAAARVEIDRLNAQRIRLEKETRLTEKVLDDLNLTAEEEKSKPSFPTRFSARWWVVFLCVILILSLGATAVFIIGSVYLSSMQSWVSAGLMACPWIVTAIAAEIYVLLTRRVDSPRATWPLRAALLLLVSGILMWLHGLYSLAEPLSLSDLSLRDILIPDRRSAVIGQLLCEAAGSFFALNGIVAQITYCRELRLNENRRRISEYLEKLNRDLIALNRELAGALEALAEPEGNRRTWDCSRAAFIAEGLAIWQLRTDDGNFFADTQRVLDAIQQQRGEKQRLLSQFTTNLNEK